MTTYRGLSFNLFDHPHNTTILNERAVEVPVGRDFADRPGVGLEVGHVLGHYGPVSHRVVDRYEHAVGVENIDVFDIDGTWDWILAISTLEHVGNWPGEPADPARAVDAVMYLKRRLRPGGSMLVTVPFDQNPALDKAICAGELGEKHSTTMMWSNGEWTERSGAHWAARRDGVVWPSALWVGEW